MVSNQKYIVGVDEAGRGPLAGPVAVGVVAFLNDFDILTTFPGLNDSKKLSEKKREAIFSILQSEIKKGNVKSVVQLVSAQKIDEGGIVPAIASAVEKGVLKLLPDTSCGKVYLDGALRAPLEYEQETIIGGDGLVPAIMLASIAAKVTRDRYMTQQADIYPLYGFEKHKGYGTKVHIDALRKHGLCAIHRGTFIHLDRVHIEA